MDIEKIMIEEVREIMTVRKVMMIEEVREDRE